MSKKKTTVSYKIIRFLIKLFYPKITVDGLENMPKEASVIVGNHTQMNGPICSEIYFPNEPYIWCAGEMMAWKEVPKYAFMDFWSQKPRWTHPFFKLAAYILTPLSVCIFNNARTIGVYHDTRIMTTFKTTVHKLKEGTNVIIFPEHNVKHNNILYDFQDKFIDIAKLYYKRTGKKLSFVPMYIAPKLKKVYIGKAVEFDPDVSIEEERARIKEYLMNEITSIARALPKHTVIPYRNIPKKDYPLNIPKEEL